MFPEAYIKRIKKQPYINSEGLLRALEEPSPVTIRINRAKWDNDPLNSEPVPWCRDGSYLDTRPSYTLDPLFHAGCYYPQEASSMFLEEAYKQVAVNKKGIKVLDLCGAPGGKSTHLSSLIGQEGLLVSPAQIREFLLPRMKRMIDLAHQSDVYVFHHSDGSIVKIIPDMIAAGIDVLNPVQWRCKDMDREQIKRNYGDQLIFHGGVDNQYTLAFGQVHKVREEVIDNLRILGANGGYILAPCHNIQAVSPAENVVAMYDTGYEYGWQ